MFFLFFPPYCLSLDSGLNPEVGLPRAGLLIDILLHYCSLNVAFNIYIYGQADGCLGEALAVNADDERAEVIEHYATATEQRLHDEGFDTCQYGHSVTLGTGGGEGDILCQVIEGVVVHLHRATRCIGSAVYTVGILAFEYFVIDCHNSFLFGQRTRFVPTSKSQTRLNSFCECSQSSKAQPLTDNGQQTPPDDSLRFRYRLR